MSAIGESGHGVLHCICLLLPQADIVPFHGASLKRYDALSLALGATVRRREFITVFGGAAATWPLAVRAQQPERSRRVGLLLGYSEGDAEGQASAAAFRQKLQELGWTETEISGSIRVGLAPIPTRRGPLPKSWSA